MCSIQRILEIFINLRPVWRRSFFTYLKHCPVVFYNLFFHFYHLGDSLMESEQLWRNFFFLKTQSLKLPSKAHIFKCHWSFVFILFSSLGAHRGIHVFFKKATVYHLAIAQSQKQFCKVFLRKAILMKVQLTSKKSFSLRNLLILHVNLP